MVFCGSQGKTLCKKKAELQTFLKLIETQCNQWDTDRAITPNSMKFIYVVRQTNKQSGQFGRALLMMHGTSMEIEFLGKSERIREIPHLAHVYLKVLR